MNNKECNSIDEYERNIISDPNNSYIWINYIAYKMETEGIE